MGSRESYKETTVKTETFGALLGFLSTLPSWQLGDMERFMAEAKDRGNHIRVEFRLVEVKS
jgi:hypothetical protein